LSDVIVAIGLARPYGAPVLIVDPTTGPDPSVAAWLDKSSASIDSLIVVDSSGTVSADVQAKIAGLVSGPLGHTSAVNPKTTATAGAEG
jgi:hypothetical protein